jgi:anti-anti-sigma factor
MARSSSRSSRPSSGPPGRPSSCGRRGPQCFLIDLSRAHYASSTAFAVLVEFARDVSAACGQLKISGLLPEVLVGARIIGLNRLVEIYEDERSPLGAF